VYGGLSSFLNWLAFYWWSCSSEMVSLSVQADWCPLTGGCFCHLASCLVRRPSRDVCVFQKKIRNVTSCHISLAKFYPIFDDFRKWPQKWKKNADDFKHEDNPKKLERSQKGRWPQKIRRSQKWIWPEKWLPQNWRPYFKWRQSNEWRQPKNKDDSKNEEDPKNEDNLKY